MSSLKTVPKRYKKNVLKNAIQSMPAGGVLNVIVTQNKLKGEITIEIKDTGVGIPAEILPHVFEPFFTARHRGPEKSSGLGLAIARSIIKRVKGEITMKSNLRQGTAVKITLPAKI